MKRVGVIGAGFSGLSAACFLAKEGFDVTVFEKNSTPGGRARKFEAQGFTFDMGPSWYWMPDVFESFFAHFHKQASDYYQLVRLDPSYKIFYSEDDTLDIPAGVAALCQTFENIEPGSSAQLLRFLEEGKYKYEVGLRELAHKPWLSIRELLDADLLKGLLKLHVFQNMGDYIRKYFKHPHLIQLLEFPVLFLGASPRHTPALYSLMNYADMALGTWYPVGGMYKVVEGMVSLASSLQVKFAYNSTVQKILTGLQQADALLVNDEVHYFDYIVAAADYHHVEQSLLPQAYRQYSEQYWQTRTLAPSALVFYIGVNKPLKNLRHHNLLFDADFEQHTKEIYQDPAWPTHPLFYACCPSRTDASVAPPEHENLFILIPVAPALVDNASIQQKYLDIVIARLEQMTGENLRDHLVYVRAFGQRDFTTAYNAYQGNAYGLANTLRQTANLKPSLVSNKVGNLFYAGQLTVPGPGVPPALISGQLAAEQVIKHSKSRVRQLTPTT